MKIYPKKKWSPVSSCGSWKKDNRTTQSTYHKWHQHKRVAHQRQELIQEHHLRKTHHAKRAGRAGDVTIGSIAESLESAVIRMMNHGCLRVKNAKSAFPAGKEITHTVPENASLQNKRQERMANELGAAYNPMNLVSNETQNQQQESEQ